MQFLQPGSLSLWKDGVFGGQGGLSRIKAFRGLSHYLPLRSEQDCHSEIYTWIFYDCHHLYTTPGEVSLCSPFIWMRNLREKEFLNKFECKL